MKKRRYKMCLICEGYQLKHGSYHPFHRAIGARFEVSHYFVGSRWLRKIAEINSYVDFDVVMWFVRFRKLAEKPPFDWMDYSGLKVMYDHDVNQNFPSAAGGNEYQGMWPKVFKENGFQILVCTGKEICRRIEREGIETFWLPKAYNPKKFFNKNEPRGGVCYYGKLYPSRVEMLSYLAERGVEITAKIQCPESVLNDFLNQYQTGLICNMVKDPEQGVLRPGTEPMIKNFEIPASGCVPFCDEIPELFDLGFEDGATMVSYRSFNELHEKLVYYLKRPEVVSQISERATRLCLERHTWEHRAAELENFIAETLG